MNKAVPIIGFLVLSIMVVMLFGMAAYEAWMLQPVAGVLVTVALVGLILQIVTEGRKLASVSPSGVFTHKALRNFLSVFVGVFVSYALNHEAGLGSVVAAGLVAVVAALVLPAQGVPLYCGSFVGMASTKLLGTYPDVAVAAILASVLYVLTVDVFGGFGGKLGTIAFTGCVVTGLCFEGEFSHPAVASWDVAWQIILISVVAAVVTYWLSVNMKHGAVMASGIVGVVAGLVLPAMNTDIGGTLAVMAICASFAGMSSSARFPTIWPMLAAGFVTGLVFVYGAPFLGGAGGKLGTTAFGSVMAVRAFMSLIPGTGSSERG
jgi:hypothetical protein